jgi:hypothetical protein
MSSPIEQPIAIDNMLIDGLVAELVDKLITVIPDGDPTKANVVRAGKLQNNPTKGTGINVLVWPEEESKPGKLHTNRESAKGIVSPVYEIGGGAFYSHPFRIYLLLHFKAYRGDEGRIEARTQAYVLLSRIRKTLHMMALPTNPNTGQPKDDFGESAIEIQIDDFWMREGGGDGQFIWRGEISFFFLTHTDTRYN